MCALVDRRLMVSLVRLVLLLVFLSTPAHGAMWVVWNLGDSGAGSLRDQIAGANPGDTIGFSVTGTIVLTSGEIAIGKNLTISGPGAASLTVQQTAAARVFSVTAGTVTISGLTIEGGNVTGDGGGILNVATLTVQDCVIQGNAATGEGGGIYNNNGTLTVTSTTFTGNTSTASGLQVGGGALSAARSSWSWATTVTRSTFIGNSAPAGGGGAMHFRDVGGHTVTNCTFSGNSGMYGSSIRTTAGNTMGGTRVVLNNCTITANTGSEAVSNSGLTTYQNTIISGNPSGNYSNGGAWIENNCIIGGAPLLDALGYYGGTTQSYALLSGSAAINAGSGCAATDQRGVARPIGAACDIGAFETDLADVSITVTDGVTSRSRGSVITYTVVASNFGPSTTDARVVDTFPAGLTGVAWMCAPAGGAACGAASGVGNIDETVSLPSGGTVTYSISALVSATATGTLTNSPTVATATSGLADANTANNTASDSFLVNVVTNLNDSGAGSLRDVISAANSEDTIDFAVTGTIVLASTISINKNLEFIGPGASSLTVSGNNSVRVFYVLSATVSMFGMTIANGNSTSAPMFPGEGGGILSDTSSLILDGCVVTGNVAGDASSSPPGGQGGGIIHNYGTLVIRNSTISNNTAGYGSGVETSSALIMVNSTVSGNTATFWGGAGILIVSSGASADVSSVTITGNTAPNGAGLASNMAQPVTIRNSIIAGNSGGDCETVSINSQGYNVIGTGCSGWIGTDKTGQTPLLGPLQVNGGQTPTHGLLSGSPALDAGNPAGCTDNLGITLFYDQRGPGYARVKGTACDAGAFEASYVSGTLGVAGAGGTVTYTGGTTTADASTGDYSFTVPQDWTGTITPSKLGYVFAPTLINVTVPVTDSLTGQDFTATLCAYSLPVPSVSLGSGAAANETFAVNASDGSCPAPAAVSNAAWITGVVVSGAATPFTVTYNVDANTGVARMGTITAAGQTFTVDQADGCAANTTLNPTNTSVPYAGAAGQTFQIQLDGGCAWTAISNDGWITVTSGVSGSGTGTVTFDVAANVGLARIGTITAGGQTFTVDQADGCAANTTLNPTNTSVPYAGATGQSFQTQLDGGCPWTAISNNGWITVTSGASGSGTGTVTFDVAANVGPARIGTITAGGQTFTVDQADGCAANTTLNPTNTSVPYAGAAGQTFQIQLDGGCPWTAIANNGWITVTSGASGSGTGTVTFDVAANVGPARIGTITAGGQTFTVDQADGCAANTTLNPTNASVPYAGATGQTFQIQLDGGCPWTAISNDGWITVTSGASGSGTGTVTFDVAANVGLPRIGTITAGGQTFTIDQADGCAANTTLNPTNTSVPYAGAAGQTFQIQLDGGCPWTAISNNGWITVTSGASGSGTGTVTFDVAANVGLPRIGTITAGGQTFTVDQADGCAANTFLRPSSASLPATGATGQAFQVQTTATCPWTAASNAAWITITSGASGTGTGLVSYDVAANTDPDRIGTITAGAQIFTVSQADGCAANTSISPTNASVPATGLSDQTIQVQTSAACPWSAASLEAWITITSGTPGTGSGAVTYSVAPNVGPARVGTINAAGKTFTVNQADGCAANTILNPGSASVAAGAVTGLTFEVLTPGACAWTSTTNSSWLTITSGGSGTGNGIVTYSVAPNVGLSRSGSLTAAGQTFTVDQSDGCSANTSLSPASASVAATGAAGQTFLVQVAGGCPWTAVSNAAWITVTSGASGPGTAIVTYTVAANAGTGRTGTITAGGQTFTVNQADGCAANTTLNPASASAEATGASNQTFQVQAAGGCLWLATSNASWITISSGTSGTGTGMVTYSVAANSGPARTGTLTAASQTFTVNQAENCSVNTTLNPSSTGIEATGATGQTFKVMTPASCPWTATSNAPWITITSGASGSGTGTVAYAVAPNTGTGRTGTVTAGGQTFTVDQADGCAANTTLSPASASVSASGATGQTFQVQTGAGCPWTATSNAEWITITSDTSGIGTGIITYSVAPSAGPGRTGTIAAGGRTFTVNQADGCTSSATLDPTGSSVPAQGAVGQTFQVQTTAGCPWTATSNAPWISITSPASGAGEGTVTYNVAANIGPERTGTISAAGSAFAVFQESACVVPATPVLTSYPEAPVVAGNSFTVAWGAVADLPGTGYYQVQVSADAECSSLATITTTFEPSITLPTEPAKESVFCIRVRSVPGGICDLDYASQYSPSIIVRSLPLPAAFTVIQGQTPLARVNRNEAPPTGSTVVFRNVGEGEGTLSFSTVGESFSISPLASAQVAPGADVTVDILFAADSTTSVGVKTGELIGTWNSGDESQSASTVITLTVLEAEAQSTNGIRLEPVGSSLVYFRLPGDTPSRLVTVKRTVNPPPQQVTIRNSGSLPVRLAPSIGPGGSWLSISGDFASPLAPYAERTFDLFVDRDKRTTEDGPPPLSTILRIDNVDGNPEDSAFFSVFDEEPPPPVDGTNRSDLTDAEFSLIMGSSVSTTKSISLGRESRESPGGTQFLSNGWIRNRGSDPISVDLYYTPQGAEGITDPGVKKNTIFLEGYTAYRLADFVKGLFRETGSGLVELRSPQLPQVSVRSAVDSITSRDGVPALYGAELPILVSGQGVGVPSGNDPAEVILITGLKGPLAAHRSNIICAETSGKTIEARVTLFDATGTKLGEKTILVHPYSKAQVDSGDPDLFPVPYTDGIVEIAPVNGEGTVAAFATVIDNRSQSYAVRLGTVIVQVKPRSRTHLSSSTAFLPTIVHEKTSDAFYTTSLSVTNGSDSDVTLQVTFIPDQGLGDVTEPRSLVIPKPEDTEGQAGPSTVNYGDVLKGLFGIEDGTRGMLRFEGALSGLVFASETTTPIDPENPEMGNSLSSIIPAPGADPKFPGVFSVESVEVLGVRQSETDTVKAEVSLPAIEEGAQYRTNLILAELAGQPAKVKVFLRTAGGASLGTPLVVELGPNERKQISRVILEIIKPPASTTEFKDVEIIAQAVEGKGRTLALVSRLSNDPKSKRIDTYVLGPNVTSSAKRGGKK